MCGHYNGTMADETISETNYKNQWNAVVNGTCFGNKDFTLNDFPIRTSSSK